MKTGRVVEGRGASAASFLKNLCTTVFGCDRVSDLLPNIKRVAAFAVLLKPLEYAF